MKTLETVLISLLFAGMIVDVFNIAPVVSNQRTILVPTERPTIQEAINVASPGDTIHVSKGAYYEHLTITKNNLKLVGENPNTTIIDGNQTGTVVNVLADNFTITGFTIRRSGDDGEGFYLDHSNNTVIINNTFYGCHVGISLEHSKHNKIIRNTIIDNSEGIILAVYSTHNIISENVLTNNSQAINIRAYATNNNLSKNMIANNWDGVFLSLTNNNTILGNTVTQNRQGISLYRSSGNIFYHNNFINNTNQVYFDYSLTNLWDNGTEGNYWSDYVGNDTNGNGIGDTPYVIDPNNRDNYPLMHLWRQDAGRVEGSTYIKEAIIIAVSILVGAGIAIYALKIKRKA